MRTKTTQTVGAADRTPTVGARLGHRPGLDALRGVAVASIVAYHADPDWFPLAPVSLDVFFVLSTFLVTTLLLEALEHRGGPGGRRFFTRRTRRLVPGLATMLAVVVALVASGVFSHPDTARTAAGAALLHANVAQFSGDYFAAFAQRNPLEHTWSLSVEEHFYLFTFAALGLLWWLGGRNHRRTRIGLLVVSVIVGIAAVVASRHLLSIGASANRIYMGTDTRAVAAAAGIALAALAWGRWDMPGRIGRLLGAGAWVLLGVAAVSLATGWHPTLEWYARGGWAVTAAAGALVVAAAARFRSAGPISGNSVLQWAGRRSYGIYLWHLPILVLAGEAGGWVLAAALAATALAAEASHRFVEHRVRTGAFADRDFLFAAVGSVAVIAIVAIALPEPPRPEWAVEVDAAHSEPPPAPPEETSAGPGTPAPSEPPAPVRVLVWGDSTADLLAGPLAADGRFSVVGQSHPECDRPAECAAVAPSLPPGGVDAVIVTVRSVDPFHPAITDPWDLGAPERRAAELWLRIAKAAAGTPIVLAMAPEARRDLGVGLHVRRMATDDPANLVLDAEPQQWPEAIADRFSEQPAEEEPLRVLVLGDSVAYSLATAFRPEGTVVWDQSRHGCDPSPGDRVTVRDGRDRTPAACDWRTEWKRAVESWEADVIVWHTGTWSTYDRHLEGRHLATGTSEWHDAVAGAHAEALRILTARGARVVVAVVAPAWETARGKPIETSPEESARRMPELATAVRSAAAGFEDVSVLDTADTLCRPDCNRPELREDGVHYTPAGARLVADWLGAQLPRSR